MVRPTAAMMKIRREAAVQIPITAISFVRVCLAASIGKTSRAYKEASDGSGRRQGNLEFMLCRKALS
jgi:hypothetical protein